MYILTAKLWIALGLTSRQPPTNPTQNVEYPILQGPLASERPSQELFYLGNNAFSRVTGEYIDREECNGGYVLYPDMAAYEEAVRTADERSAIKKIVDADFYGYDPFSCWRTYTVSDAAVHEIYRILVECGAIKTSTEEGKPDGKSAE